MTVDLLTLKMAIVAGDGATTDFLSRAAATTPVPIEVMTFGFDETAPALDALADGVDMFFLDGGLSPDLRRTLVETARAARERAIIVSIGAPDVEASSNGGNADAVLEKPVDMLKARAAVACCARARRPNRVLVVDDSPTVRSIVRKMMRVSRFSLATEETGEGAAALELMRSGRFDIVFLDCDMPGLDGFATVTEIRRDHPGMATVMMTGTPDPSIAARAHAAGATGFLFKPFFPKDIDAVLHGLFGLNAPRAARA